MRKILFFLFTIININVYSQVVNGQFLIGGNQEEASAATIQLSNGDYLFCGTTQSYGSGMQDLMLIRFKPDFSIVWQKTIGSSNNDFFNGIAEPIENNDGSFTLLANTRSFGMGMADVLLLKVSSTGNVVWSKVYGGTREERGVTLRTTLDGGYIFAGSTDSYNTSTSTVVERDLLLVKVNSIGNVVWSLTWGTTANNNAATANVSTQFGDIVALPDSTFLVAGIFEAITGAQANNFIARINSNGTINWFKRYTTSNSAGHEAINSIVVQNSTNAFATGLTKSGNIGSTGRGLLFSFNINTGNVNWSKVFGNPTSTYNWIFKGYKENPNRYVLNLYENGTGFGNFDVACFSIDSNGVVLQKKVFGTSTIDGSIVFKQTSDQGYLFSATSGNGVNRDAYIIKTDKLWNSFCNETNITINSANINITPQNYNPTIVTTINSSSVSLSSNPVNVVIDTLCIDIISICNLNTNFSYTNTCVGDSAFFTDLSIDSLGSIINWKWYFGDGDSIVGIQNPSHLYNTPGTYNVTLVVTNDSNCTDTMSLFLDVNSLPTLITVKDTAICIGASANVLASGANTYVWDNGLPATAGIHSVSPLVTTTYTVTGTDVNGCMNDSTVTITVNPLPTITTSDEAVCKDNPISLTANGGVSYTWVTLDGGLINSGGTTATPEVETNNPTATADEIRRYVVTGTDANGCVNTDTSTVTFNYICGLTIRASGDTICIGEVAQLTSYSSFVTGAITYAWTPTTGLNDPTIANPTVTGLATTTVYQIIATDDVASDTATTTIYVNPLPTPNVGLDQTICVNSSATISATSSTGTGPYSFVWNNGLPNGAGPHIVSPAVGTTPYIVTVTDANTCVAKDTVNVIVNPTPTIVASDDTTICSGVSVTLTGTGGAIYQWKDLTTGDPLSTGALLLVEPTAPNTCYEVTGTDALNCSSSDVVCVTVQQAPAIGFNVPDVCDGDITIFSNTTTGGATYSWILGDGASSNVFNPQHVYPDSGNYTVTLVATSQAGCVSTKTDTARVNYVPVVNFDGINLTGCPPVNAIFTNRTDCMDPSFTYSWDFGDGTTSSLKDTLIYHTYTVTGTYTVKLTVSFKGCSNNLEISNYITVHPVPDAHFTANPPVVDIYNPIISFTDLSIGADKWFWDFGDNKGSKQQHPIHTYDNIDTFLVYLTVVNIPYRCVDTASILVIVKDNHTFFAPNAFTPEEGGLNNTFLPQGIAIDYDNYRLDIYDRWGELIYQSEDYYSGWNGKVKGALVQMDTYVWKVSLKDIFGGSHNYIGRVTLIR